MPSLSHGHGYTVDESSSSAATRRRGSSSSSDENMPPHISSSTHIDTHHSNNNSNGNDTGNDSSNKNHCDSITSDSTRSINRISINNKNSRDRQEKNMVGKPSSSLSPIARAKLFFQGLHKSFIGNDGPGLQAGNGHRVDPSLLLESNYRILPLLIGCIIPVSILINVPSITSPWVGIPLNGTNPNNDNDPKVIPIPHWLNSMIILALVMAIICNICVLFRFLERHVWHSVILSLITATLQDVLCIGSIVPFCILYPPSKGYVYLEGFWTMIASMVFSLTATVLMSIDFHRTPQFRLQGSGVTHKQRILIAEAMSLCFYLAIGALIFIYIEHWTFLDALFFVMVTITTIGFGDRVPETTGGRVFVIFYGAGGIVLLAMAVNAIRYVILEDLHRRFAIRAKERKAKRDARRQQRREQRAIEEERRQHLLEILERIQQSEPTPADSNSPNETHGRTHYFTHYPRQFALSHGHPSKLLSMFSRTQTKEASETGHVVESGLTEESQQPKTLHRTLDELQLSGIGITAEDYHRALESLGGEETTHLELLRLATMEPRQFQAFKKPSFFKRLLPFRRRSDIETPIQNPTAEEQREADKRQAYEESMQEYQRRLRFSAAMFATFWLAGAVIFTFVESWDFGDSVYFVFIAFTTIGYGDFVPETMAGRAIFLAYCLVGVVTLTSLASLISEVLSKSMRRHVVETQLRRTERIEALEGDREQEENNDGDVDLEHGATMDSSNEDGPFQERLDELNNVVRTQNEDNQSSQASSTCRGSLENLVKISKDFDQLLQKVLGLDYMESESRSASTGATTPPPPPSTPGAIVEYLEKEEDEELHSSFLSPSISRDINSTSSIHRHSIRPSSHGRRHSIDPRGGTFHGFGSSSSSDASQLQIKAWPTSISSHSNMGSERNTLNPSPAPSWPITSTGSTHRHNKDGTIAIAAIHWQHLIEYSKQFKVLTAACEEALERVAAWEISESKLRQKRYQARMRHKRLLNERRRRLNELENHGAADNEIEEEEDELEELEEWDEEGSDVDEDDEILDKRRAKIAAALLGSRNPKKSRSRHTSRHSSRHPSRRSSLQFDGGMDPNFLKPPVQPMALPLQLRTRNPRLDDEFGHQNRSRSRSKERRPSHNLRSRHDIQPQQHTTTHHSAHITHPARTHRHVHHDRHNHGQHIEVSSDPARKTGPSRPLQPPPLQTNTIVFSSSPFDQAAEPRIALTAATPHPLDCDEPSIDSGSGSPRAMRSPLGHLFQPAPEEAPKKTAL